MNERIWIFCHISPEILETCNFDFKFQVFPDCKAKKQKQIRLVFGRIYGAAICLQLYLTFIQQQGLRAYCPNIYSVISPEVQHQTWSIQFQCNMPKSKSYIQNRLKAYSFLNTQSRVNCWYWKKTIHIFKKKVDHSLVILEDEAWIRPSVQCFFSKIFLHLLKVS